MIFFVECYFAVVSALCILFPPIGLAYYSGSTYRRTTIFPLRAEKANWDLNLKYLYRGFFSLKDFISSQKLDISAGAGSISAPSEEEEDRGKSEIVSPSLAIKAHKIAKNVVRRVPEPALAGLLVLMTSELLRREINSKTSALSPNVKDIMNATVNELDTKIELLSNYGWDIDPFLKSELEILKDLPFDAIDKFIAQDILPKVDKELTPYLLKLLGDTTTVTSVTKRIKERVESALLSLTLDSYAQLSNGVTTIRPVVPVLPPSTTSTILEQVDIVGAAVEKGERYCCLCQSALHPKADWL